MAEPEVGRRFGPYEIEARIGAGGMGSVYRARDPVLGRRVALKVMLRPDAEDPDDDGRARFLREARLLASMSSAGIVVVLDVGEVDGTPYLAMEWIDGQPLSVLLRTPMSSAAALPLLTGIAQSLAAAHRQGVVHRDLKPANIVVGRDGRPTLVDFGIAKRARPAESPHPLTFATRDDLVLGTPSYMAPEQTSTANVDARADQFAWGVIAYEALAGLHPRHLVGAFPFEPPPPLATQCPELPVSVVTAVDRALAVDAAKRFASMDELLAGLVRPFAPAVLVRAAPAPSAGRRLLVLVTAALLTVVMGVLLAAGFFVLRAPPAPSATPQRPSPTTVAPPSPSPDADASLMESDAAPVTSGSGTGAPRAVVAPKKVSKQCSCRDADQWELCYEVAVGCWCADTALDNPHTSELCAVPWEFSPNAVCGNFEYGTDVEKRGHSCRGYRRTMTPNSNAVVGVIRCSACRNSKDVRRPGIAGARCEGFRWGTGEPTKGTLSCTD